MNVTNSFQEEASPSTVATQETDSSSKEVVSAPEPAWGDSIATAL